MPQKKSGRGRPRRTARASSGSPVAKRKKGRISKTPSSTAEPTSAFEALCQVTSAELERLNNNNPAVVGNGDTRSDSSTKSTEENRTINVVRSSPMQATLPPWYGSLMQPKPPKPELILPPKKKKYLHYLAEAEDDNNIINDPFRPREQQSPPTNSEVPSTSRETTSSASTSNSDGNLVPLRFNPTTVSPSTSRSAQDINTFSDLLDEHISRLISQNETIVSKQQSIIMNKRGRSRDSTSISRSQDMESPRPSTSTHTDSMVKTLLSSKLTRKSMLAREMAEQRQQLANSGSSFSYLNPEKSAIKDLLIKTYEDKGGLSGLECLKVSPDRPEFKYPCSQAGTSCTSHFMISSDQHGGALVIPDSGHDGKRSWTVLFGNEWVFVDECGRKRVRPEVTVCPEAAVYQTVAPSPARSIRSPSVDSMVSSESVPSSGSRTSLQNRMILTSGTFLPGTSNRDGRLVNPSPVNVSVVKTAGIFHPVSSQEKSSACQEPRRSIHIEQEFGGESHEKALIALRGHLTGKRPTEDTSTSKIEVPTPESCMLPPKKRKLLHFIDKPVSVAEGAASSPSTDDVLQSHSNSQVANLVAPRQSAVLLQPHQMKQEPLFSGYATYVNENHPSHLSFYSDLSRQYSTNLAFAQTLLLQGHGFPSFRYSCVTTNSIRATRPIHVPNGEQFSMYSNWSPSAPLVNPTIHVDSSGYGKKKSEESYYSSATKRSVIVGATSVEAYNCKRQLILTGQNSFLPADAARLNSADFPNVGYYDSEASTSTDNNRRNLTGSQRIQPAVLEDVSEDESEAVCSHCSRKCSNSQRKDDRPLICTSCAVSKVEGSPKKSRKKAPDAGSSIAVSESGSSGCISEKQLIAQRLQQKIIDHQNGQLSHNDTVLRNSSVPKVTTDKNNHDAMDLSIKKSASYDTGARNFDGSSNKFPCNHCGKIFNKEAQLYLHIRVHDMESPSKADKRCQKLRREGSTSPTGNGSQIAATNGNPRPFTCAECSVGFRIHGHLQKHLRSKGHITQLECLGRLPPGLYAELERQNMTAKLHTLVDTADCSKAFTSLVHLAKTVHVGAQSESDSASKLAHS